MLKFFGSLLKSHQFPRFLYFKDGCNSPLALWPHKIRFAFDPPNEMR
uniref:Uncharacterized protein n=1 Tax=Utricularia reniformis TaxID=192314 RepID=A0A1Y0B488_9LAMI|nr:hypothetical protein AEK19_MT2046 [Utricularia reniformis]ART32203.1 hypothetical protein AEK19_MT2046 [Utricularia reniformis]